MQTKGRIAAALVLALLFAFALAVTGEDKKSPPDKITLTAPKGVKKPKGDVEFGHKKHSDPKDKEGLGYTCKKCHHKMKTDKDTPGKCGSCHKIEKEGNTPRFKDAFHDQCKKCHKDKDGKDNEKAPKKCKGCHKKK